MTVDANDPLERLLSVQAFEVRLVARRGEHYVLLVRRADAAGVRLELGTADAGARFDVDDPMRQRLDASGFARLAGDASPRPWGSEHGDTSADELLARVNAGFDALLGADGGAAAAEVQYELTVEAEAPPDNPKLIEAMRAVARSAAVAERQALYAALVNATLLVPLDPETLSQAPEAQQPLVVDELEGQPVIAVFSDAQSLRSWRHAGHPWAGVHGADFFSHAERAGVGAVRINPGGKVGGEIYRNEVEAITEGVRRFHARSMN